MASWDDDLELLRDAAGEAASIAVSYFRRDPEVWWKEGNSPVSEADYAVDRFLQQRLLGARGGYGWVSEEMPPESAAGPGEAEPERFFVVDPIDGTRAYLRGEDTWCVSVAVVENGRPVAGVIAAPMLQETFAVTAEGPALLNGGPCEVSRPAAADVLGLAVPEAMRKRVATAGDGGVSIEKAVPSLAYRLALVASGRLDGTLIRARANDWDIAAADLLIERAGGLLCDREGRRTLYTSKGRRHGVLMAASLDAMPRVRDLADAISD